MQQIYVSWVISALVLVGTAVALGYVTKAHSWLGILVDSRGRMSLTHFQLVVWSLLILSLVSGVFFGRLVAGVPDPLGFGVPDQLLGLIGITTGSAVAATAAKTAKDNDPKASRRIPVSDDGAGDRPSLSQLFTLEEGALADEVIDVTKFQNLMITVVLVVAYAALSWKAIGDASTAAPLATLPALSSQFVTLLGISHAGYVAGKLPNQAGPPGDKPTVSERNAQRVHEAQSARAERGTGPATVAPQEALGAPTPAETHAATPAEPAAATPAATSAEPPAVTSAQTAATPAPNDARPRRTRKPR